MTKDEALKAAIERWGKGAALQEQQNQARGITQCHVGRVIRIFDYRSYEILGVGDSWEAAFANADRHERRRVLSRCAPTGRVC